MKIKYYPIFLIMLIACQQEQQEQEQQQQQEQQQANSWNHLQLAEVILQQTALTEGERVLLVGTPGEFDPLVELLVAGIKENGGQYLGCLSVDSTTPDHWKTDFTETVGENEQSMKEAFEGKVDLGIMLPGATPSHMPYKVLQDLLWDGPGRTVHFHWAGAYDLNGNLLDTDFNRGSFYTEVLKNTDYKQLAADQLAFEEAMRNNVIRIQTPGGTDISFEIGDRPVTKQDGDASLAAMNDARNLIDREIELPAGAVRVAPVETTVNGRVAFPDGVWNEQPVKGLVMEFKAGRLVSYTAEAGQDAVAQELEAAGEAGQQFREFALGMNPLMTVQNDSIPWIPYYGYGAGIVRLSLGDNKELGGNVGGGYVRWNFFIDATVHVGDSLWVEDGNLVSP